MIRSDVTADLSKADPSDNERLLDDEVFHVIVDPHSCESDCFLAVGREADGQPVPKSPRRDKLRQIFTSGSLNPDLTGTPSKKKGKPDTRIKVPQKCGKRLGTAA